MTEAKLILFTFVLARMAGLMITAPFYGTSDVPLRIRALLGATLALLVVPSQCDAAISPIGNVVNYAALLAIETLLGACLGLGVLILIHGMSLAGELVAQTSGLAIANVFDPSLDENVPLFSRLMFLLSVCVFLCVGGHRMVMAGLLDTFQTIPPGSGSIPGSLGDAFVTLIAQSFSLGIRAAAPAVTALLVSTLILGLVGRTLPQLNILSVGFGLNAMLAFAALGLALGVAVWALSGQIVPAVQTILDTFEIPVKTQWFTP